MGIKDIGRFDRRAIKIDYIVLNKLILFIGFVINYHGNKNQKTSIY
jgi:hypothetical protein